MRGQRFVLSILYLPLKTKFYLLLEQEVKFGQKSEILILHWKARSVFQDFGLDILQNEKQTQLIDSNYNIVTKSNI